MTGYERVKEDEVYYIDEYGMVGMFDESNDETDDCSYKTANYYSDETVAKNNARADKLMRQLRRYAVEHNEGEMDWGNINQSKFFIVYDFDGEEIFVSWVTCARDFGQIYFTSEEIAEQAIEEFKNELLWYFTEYTDHFVDVNKIEETQCDCGNPEKLQAMQTLGFKYCPKCGKELKEQ